jgi:hypothetical protein
MKLHIDYSMTALMRPHLRGWAKKDMIVLHETISPDVVGLGDIKGVANYLASKTWGIHGLTDEEGHVGWALGLGKGILIHCGGVNTRSIGIEQVSDIPARYHTVATQKEAWSRRTKQLTATAELVACACRAHSIPFKHSNGTGPGVASHWDVSQHFSASEGHTDCFPISRGGYYPLEEVIFQAKKFYDKGWRF